MATIYQATCKHCGYQSAQLSDGYLAVLLPQDHKAFDVPLNRTLRSHDIGELPSTEKLCLLILGHPLEDSILQSAGLTYGEVTRNGQMVHVESVVCRDCGTTFKKRTLVASSTIQGCLVGWAFCFILGLAIGYRSGSFWCGLAAWCGSLLLFAASESFMQQWKLRRFRDRANALARPTDCPSCSSHSIQLLKKSASIACPACRQKSLTFKAVAIS